MRNIENKYESENLEFGPMDSREPMGPDLGEQSMHLG